MTGRQSTQGYIKMYREERQERRDLLMNLCVGDIKPNPRNLNIDRIVVALRELLDDYERERKSAEIAWGLLERLIPQGNTEQHIVVQSNDGAGLT